MCLPPAGFPPRFQDFPGQNHCWPQEKGSGSCCWGVWKGQSSCWIQWWRASHDTRKLQEKSRIAPVLPCVLAYFNLLRISNVYARFSTSSASWNHHPRSARDSAPFPWLLTPCLMPYCAVLWFTNAPLCMQNLRLCWVALELLQLDSRQDLI